MTSLSLAERSALADTLDEVGPDAPTLCAGWTAADLVAHLIVRENNLPGALGILIKPLAGRTTDAMERLKRELGYADLVAKFRNGPTGLSPVRIAAVDAAANTSEFFIHHEDVRRAQPDHEPRRLDEALQTFLWRRLRTGGRLLFRRVAVGVLLASPDGAVVRVRAGEPTAILAGRPSELMLYAFGRKDVAKVELTGPDIATEALRQATLRV